MDVKQLIDRIATRATGPAFSVEYWDGVRTKYGTGADAFVLHLRDRNACARMLGNLSLRFGEAYMTGAIDVQGDLHDVARLFFAVDPLDLHLSTWEKVKIALAAWRQRNSLAGASKNIKHHYDLGNDFFGLWLGREMCYTCAYFHSHDDTIDQAQEQKLAHVCEKLRLSAGDRMLDIGCGWGGLAIYAAQRYGASVLGVTLSPQQKEFADQRIAALGLSKKVSIELTDYRQLPTNQQFDKIASVGMFEHVGKGNIVDYFYRTAAHLRPGGLGLLHTIGRMIPSVTDSWIKTYIFPGIHLPTLSEIATPMGSCGLNITDVEVLRLHYALTLDRWSEGFERHAGRVRAEYGDKFVRMWRLYLRGCAASFRSGRTCLWQVQFTRGVANDLPLTRAYLYEATEDQSDVAADGEVNQNAFLAAGHGLPSDAATTSRSISVAVNETRGMS